MTQSNLKQVHFFVSLNDDEFRELEKELSHETAVEGTILFHTGDVGNSFYLVEEGHVELSIRDHTGLKVILKIAGPGDFFGELSLLDHGPRTATALALEECQLAVLTQDDLHDFLKRKPGVALDLLATLTGELRKTNDLVRGRVSRNASLEAEHHLTHTQKIAQVISDFSGSMPFLFFNILFFVAWIVLNTNQIPGIESFDPYPFGFLTMFVSLEAIILSIFVLVSQNLQTAKDKIRSDIEYDVNIKAESEIAYLHEKIDRMNDEVLKLLRNRSI